MKGNDKQKKDDNGKSDYEREQFSKKIFKCPPPPNVNIPPTNEHENILPPNEHEKRIDIPSTSENENIPSPNEYEKRRDIPPTNEHEDIPPEFRSNKTIDESKKGIAIYRTRKIMLLAL
ncbi:unnamed protein product [Rhizophagus irregularis]|nr:unnamed protein product [Rhizophagus irregularis]